MTSFDFIFRQHFAALVSYARLMVEEEDAKENDGNFAACLL